MSTNASPSYGMIRLGAPQGLSRVFLAELSLVAFCILTYLKIHLTIPGFGVPYFFSHLIAIAYLSSTARWRFILPYCAACAFLLVVQFFLTSQNSPVPNIKDVQYASYWMLNFISFFGAIFMLADSRRSFVRRAALYFASFMIIIGVLEVYAGLKPVVDAVRSLYTSSTSIYLASARDIALYGAIRPNVFTSEPSSVGNFFGLCILLYTAISVPRLTNILVTLAMTLIGLWLFRTPTILIYIIVGFVSILITHGGIIRQRAGTILSVLTFLTITIAPYTLYSLRSFIENSKLTAFLSTGSFYTRQIAPVESVFRMLSDSPLYGFGYGYGESIRDVNAKVLMSINPGHYDYARIYSMLDVQFMTNAMFEMVVINGIGGLLFIATVYFLSLKKLGARNLWASFFLSCSVLSAHAGLILTFTILPVIAICFVVSLSPARISTEALPVRRRAPTNVSPATP